MAEQLGSLENSLAKRPRVGDGRQEETEPGKQEENGHEVKRFKDNEEEVKDEAKKFPKKKVVLLLVYCGKGYHGMQVSAWI